MKNEIPVVNYIIPICKVGRNIIHGADYHYRLRNINCILNKSLRKQTDVYLNVIIAEQTLDKGFYYLESIDYPSSLKVKRVKINYEVFNKSWIYNCAAKEADGEHLIFAESDVYCHTDFLKDFMAFVIDNNIKWAFCWNKLCYISAENTERLLTNGEKILAGRILTQRVGKSAEGGLIYFRKDFFKSIGSYNEWMEKLGGIDNEICARARLTSGNYPCFNNTIYHLWHPIVKNDRRPDEGRIKNSRIFKHTNANVESVINFLNNHRQGSIEGPACKYNPLPFDV